jgi:hypothetical protein
VAPVKFADFDIVGGYPTTNIGDLRKVRTVVKDGKVVDVGEVDRELDVLL